MKTRHLLTLAALAALAWSMTACALTIGPDGSKSATVEGEGVAKVIEATK